MGAKIKLVLVSALSTKWCVTMQHTDINSSEVYMREFLRHVQDPVDFSDIIQAWLYVSAGAFRTIYPNPYRGQEPFFDVLSLVLRRRERGQRNVLQ